MSRISSIDQRIKWLAVENFLRTITHSGCNFFLIWYFLKITNINYNIATVIAIAAFVSIVLKLTLGWISDRYNSRHFIRLSFFSYCISIIVLCASIELNLDKALWLPVLLLSISDCFRTMISIKVIKDNAVDTEEIIGFSTSLRSLSPLLGPVAGAGLISTYEISMIEVVYLVLAAVSIFQLYLIQQNTKHLNTTIAKKNRYSSEFISGFQSLFKVKEEFYLCISASTLNFILLPVFIVFLPKVIYVDNDISTYYLILIEVLFSLGIFICARKLNGVVRNKFGLATSIYLGFLFIIAFSWSVIYADLIIIIIAAAFGGIGIAMININSSYIRAKAYYSERIGRVSNTTTAISAIFSPLGVYYFSTDPVFLDETILVSISIIIFSLVLNSGYRVMNRLNNDELNNYYKEKYNV